MEDPTTAHYMISNKISQVLIFNLLLFDRIHNAMHLEKRSRNSRQKNRATHYKYGSIGYILSLYVSNPS